MTTFDPIRVPYASTPGIGPLAGQTVNFDLNLTNFDWVAWHQYEWENWVVVDALLSAALFSVDVTGAWRPNTDYVTGNIVINTVDGSVLIAADTHTSSNDIDADIAAGHWNPYALNDAFVQTDGGTMTDDLIMQSADPGIQFNDEDSSRTWRVSQQGDNFLLLRDDGASLYLTGTDTGITGLDVVPPNGDSVMTLARTDNRYYTKTQQDVTDTAQNAAAAAANTNANNRMRWRGNWVAGTYQPNDVVQDGDFLFVATTATTEKPDNGNNPPDPADWDVLSAGGGSQTTVSDTAPTQPLQGDMWFCTVEPVGLFIWYDDGDTAQWVQTNGAAGPDQLLDTFVQKTGDTMTGNLRVEKANGSFLIGREFTTNSVDHFGIAFSQFGSPGPELFPAIGADDSGDLSLYADGGVNIISNAGGGIYGTGSTGFRVHSGGLGTTAYARFQDTGTGTTSSIEVITREKGDARYQTSSSRRFKDGIAPRDIDSGAVIDALALMQWTWGGDVPEHDERRGETGIGLIAEDVLSVLPEAVTYQWMTDDEGDDTGQKQIKGLDPLALIGVLVAEVQALRQRVTQLEGTT